MLPKRPLWQRWWQQLRPFPAEILNPQAYPTTPRLGERLHAQMRQIQTRAVTADGKRVAYGQLKADPLYRAYQQLAGELHHFDPLTLANRAERLAFWINLYNALILNAVLFYEIRQSVLELPHFFDRAAYMIGGYRVSANEIEHGILRVNAGHPARPGPQFGPADPRQAWLLDHVDPRVHFALVCGAEACPPIRFYTAAEIDAQLDLATRSFLNGSAVRLDPAQNTVHLSQILQWYGPDFGGSRWSVLGWGDRRFLLRWILPYLTEAEKRAWLEDHLAQVRVRFIPYRWALNGPG